MEEEELHIAGGAERAAGSKLSFLDWKYMLMKEGKYAGTSCLLVSVQLTKTYNVCV